MSGLFITGTDTDVGKTWVTGRLCRSLIARGHQAGVWKPVQSGHLPNDPGADSYRLKDISGVSEPVETLCSVSLPSPLAPLVAAHLEGVNLSCESLLEAGRLLFEKYDILLVEGAGGFLVPLADGELVADLAEQLGFPVLIIARHGLGTVNHCLLTIEAIRKRGLVPAGIILNGYPNEPFRVHSWEEFKPGTVMSDSSPGNPLLIEQFSQVPVIGMIPKVTGDCDGKMFDKYVNLKHLENLLN